MDRPLDFLLDGFDEFGDAEALVWSDASFSYRQLRSAFDRWYAWVAGAGITSGAVVALEADYSPTGIALLLALVEHGAIVVPLTESVETKKSQFHEIAEVEVIVRVDASGGDETTPDARIERTGRVAAHEIYRTLRDADHPGVVLFSSGSTGVPKAVVHDVTLLLEKYRVRRHAKRTISFFLFDHIGGLDTILYTLSNGGCVIAVAERSPETVCRAVERHRVEVLPVSPTFVNLLLISGAHERFDLSSLQIVSYGTEVMPESTLRRLCAVLPEVRTLQKYGLSEVGTLRSQSRGSDSCWVRIGGDGYETRVVDGLLEIKARSAMLGYLNAPSPFTDDGWMRTGDQVEVDGEYYRILGRRSEIINIGGEKFHPAEVENLLLEMDGVVDATVGSEPNPITGQIVKARVSLAEEESLPAFRKRMRAYLATRVPTYKIPQKVEIAGGALHSERFKKLRVET